MSGDMIPNKRVVYVVQQKHSGLKQANYGTKFSATSYELAVDYLKRMQRGQPSLPARIVVETYLPEWKLAKREIRMDKRFGVSA